MARYDPDRRGYRIFVGNLSAGTMHDDLADLFCPYGPIVDIWLACNPPGFGFVVFKNAEDAQNAVLGKNNSILNSRVIKVQHARMFKDRSKRKTTDQQGQTDSEGSRESRSTTRSRSRTYSRSISSSRSRSRRSSFSKIYGYPNRHRSSSRLSSKRDSRSLSSSHSSYRTLSVASSSSRSRSNSPPRSTTITRSKKRLRQRHSRPKKHRRWRGKRGHNRQRRHSSGSSRASAGSANHTLRSRSSSRSSSSSTSSSSTSSLSPSSLTSARKSQSHHNRCPYCRHCCVPRPGRKTTSRSSQHTSELSPSSLSSDVSKDAGSLHRKMKRRRAWRHSKRRRRQRSLSTSSSSSSSSQTSSTMPIKMSSHSRILDYQLRSPAKEVEPKTTQLQPAAEAQESGAEAQESNGANVPVTQSISSKDGDKWSACLKASHFLQPSDLVYCCRATKPDENGVSAARVLPTEIHRTQNIQHNNNECIKEVTVLTTCDEGKIELLLTGEGKTGLIQTDEGRSELTHKDESKEGLIFAAKGKVGLFLNDEDRSDLKLTDEGKPKIINYCQENTHIDVDKLAVEQLKDNGLICTELSVKQLTDKQLTSAVLPLKQLTSTELPVQQLTNNELPIKQLTDKELTNAEMPVKRVTDDVSTSSDLPVKRLAENKLRSTELTVNRLKVNKLIKSGPAFELLANKLDIHKSTHGNMVPKVYSHISLSTPGDESTQCCERDGFVLSKCPHPSESASRKCSEQVNILPPKTVPDVNDGNSSEFNTQPKTLSVEDDSVQSSPNASRKSHQCRLGARNMDSLFWKLKQKTCQISDNKGGGTHVSSHSKDHFAKQEVPFALAVQNTESPLKESLSNSPLSQGTKTRDTRNASKVRLPAIEHIPVAQSPTVKRIPVKFSLSQGQYSNTPQTLASSESGQKQHEFHLKEDFPVRSEKCGMLRDVPNDELLPPDRENATMINVVRDNCKVTEDNVKTCKIEAAHPSVNGQEMHFVLRNDKPLRNGAESMSHSTALRNSSHKYHATDKSNRPQQSRGRKEHTVTNVAIVSSQDHACNMFSSGRDNDRGTKNGFLTLSESETESWGRSAKRPRTCIQSPPGGQEDSKRMYSHKMKATQFSTEQTGKRFLAEASKLHNDVEQNFLDTAQTKAECHPQSALPQPKLSSLPAPVLPKPGLSSKITCALSRPELSSSSTKSHLDMSRHTSARASKRSRSNSYAFRHTDFDVRSTAIPDPHPRAYETCRKRGTSACRWNGKDKPVSCRRHSHRGSSKREHKRDTLRWFSEQRQRSTSRERWERRETMRDPFSRRLVSPSESKRRDKIKESRETSRSRHSVTVVTRGRNVRAASKRLDDKNKRYERNNHKQRGDLPKRPDGIRAESRGRCRSENKKLHRSSRQRSSQLHNGEKGGRPDIRLTSSVHVVKHHHR